MLRTLDVALLLALLANSASALVPDHLYRRNYIQDTQLQPSYDYVIAGGGLAGLVLASRLSEDPNVSVLVLEAGKSGDAVKDRVDSPAGAYYASLLNTEYDWNFKSVPQPNLGNRVISQPRGKILGGSTALNAMYVVRPSKTEVDVWAELMAGDGGDATAASRWNWDNLYKYMMKAESFTPPTKSVMGVVDIKYNQSTYGNGGPLQISYPAVMINISSTWTQSCETAGVPELTSPNGGVTLGSFITPSTMNPSNLTRSYARSAYIDSLAPRPNLHILTEYTVLKINFALQTDPAVNKVAKNVEFGKFRSSSRKTVDINKELVLAAGALSSPKILMMSGVGPKDVLESVGIKVEVPLPGVGQRLQDHMTAGIVWESSQETAGDIHASNSDFSKTKEFNSFINDAAAFANAFTLFQGGNEDFKKSVMDSLEDSVKNLVPSQYDEVKNGYRKIYEILAGRWLSASSGSTGVAQVELLMSLISPRVVAMQAAMQHPFSIGRVYVNSSNAWDEVVIDPGYHTHWADRVLMRQGIKLVRQVGAAFGSSALGTEVSPSQEVQSDQSIEDWLLHDNNGANSQFHPTGTCSMLPKNLGGVVDADLKVYGTSNVRVVDGSIFPFEFAAHLASAGYGVAEQAADLIKANIRVNTVTSSSTSSPADKNSGVRNRNNSVLAVLMTVVFPLIFSMAL